MAFSDRTGFPAVVAAIVATALLPALPAHAQVALPSREEVTPPVPDAQVESTAQVDSRAAFARSACPFDGSPLKVSLTGVSFTRPDGSPLPPVIAAVLAPLTHMSGEEGVGVVCAVRDRANAALQRAGWIASVQIPAQEINGGALQLQVVTAHLVEVRIRGSAGPYEAILRDRIARIQALDPLNEHEAERLLLLAGDIPGVGVQLSLRPAGGEQGAVIGELSIAFRRFSVLANVQNYNSRLLGRETGYVRAELYGLTGLGDLTYLGASSTSDFRKQIIAQVGHIATLDAAGTTLGGRFTYAWSRPDLGALDLRTTTLIAGGDLQRPLLRSLRLNVRARAGFDYIDQDTVVATGNADVPLTRDRLRVFFAGVDGSYSKLRFDGGTAYSLSGSLELRKGADIFGSSDRGITNGRLSSRIDGNARAFVVHGSADAVVGFNRVFSLAGSVQGQWADSPLLNYEEQALGNLTIGRGYDPGANSGDRFLGGHGELRADLPLASRIGTQLFGFYDYVYLTNIDRAAPETDRHFRSYGLGGRVSLPSRLVLEATYAHPQDKALRLDAQRPSDRILVSLTAQLRGRAR